MMRPLSAGLVLLLGTAALAQVHRSTIYSRPDVPPDEALRRLNLKKGWARYITMEGRRDGFLSIQVAGKDLLVQTRAGLVVRLDAETGRAHWRQRVGRPFQGGQGLAFNKRSVYAVNGTDLYSLSRETGTQRWRFKLPGGSSALPVADERHLYLSTAAGRIYCYYLPSTDVLAPRTTEGGEEVVEEEAQPTPRWSLRTTISLELPPLLTQHRLLVPSPSGEVRLLEKAALENTREEDLSLRGRIEVPAGQFGDVAYIASSDGFLYALAIDAGKLYWRYTAGDAIQRQPVALGEDVYVTLRRGGLTRISRVDITDPVSRRAFEAGQEMWRNAEADRFVAANPKFVYADDRSGRLLVLDRKRGTKLSMLNTRDFRFPVVNTVTDRLYLAANDGLIVCLHDRDHPRPCNHRLKEEQADPLKKKLATLVTDAGGKTGQLRAVLDGLEKKYQLKIRVVQGAFKARGVDNILAKQVKFPAVKKQSLEEVLLLILRQVGAVFDVVDDTIMVIPAPPRAKDKE
jgi:outer membrane protein assembly factor BamB